MEATLLKLRIQIKFKILKLVFPFLDPVLRSQNQNPNSIPVIIISYNQLHYLKQLIEFLQSRQFNNIIIIDNKSTYPPLLMYFTQIEDKVKVYRLNKNYGHNVFTLRQDIFKKYRQGYYVITDPDVVPDYKCPKNFMAYFKKILDSDHTIRKAGFSLRTDNIPDTNPEKSSIQKRQQVFKELARRDRNGNYYADIDTTFAMYRPKIFDFLPVPLYRAIRTKPPYSASHGGWILDPENLTEEQSVYLNSSNDSGSWKINDLGNLQNKKFE